MATYFDFGHELEEYHALFYAMWDMGRPVWTKEISTAAVSFDKVGGFVKFLFNPDFWDGLTDYDRKFVICHESLHVILNHGVRTRDSETPRLTNMALDVVVNEMLVSKFGFERSKIQNSEDYCWLDTVFPDQDIPSDQSFEYYYRLLLKNTPTVEVTTVDEHCGLGDNWGDVIDKLNNALSEEEVSSVGDMLNKHFQLPAGEIRSGDTAGNYWTFANVDKPKKKKKWESVIKKWSKQFTRQSTQSVEQWARLNRRFMFVSNNLMLPSEMETNTDEQDRICVWFFQDTSGSCASLKDRFFKAALSLPADRFDVKMHCFDTKVYETTLESKKLYGFGGTKFQPLEDYIQSYIKKHKQKYPKAVFVITDGYGSPIKPEFPERWFWFLSSTFRYYIPAKCSVYKLRDFE